jgi:hypothetical protein
MNNLIIILGSPNKDDGELLPMALGRLQKGYDIFQEKNSSGDEWLVTTTGGHGDHFNKAEQPHVYYAIIHLLNLGLPFDNLTAPSISCDTVDDAVKSQPTIERYQPEEIIVVTSDFHVERVKYIFESLYPDYNITVVGDEYLPTCDEATKQKLLEHERVELESLKKNGRSKLMDMALELKASEDYNS